MRSDGQKSLRDYFTRDKQTMVSSPSGSSFSSSPSGGKRTLSDNEAEPLSCTPAKKKASASSCVIVIDSDMDENEENLFQHSTKYRNSNLIHSPSDENTFHAPGKQRVTGSASKRTNTRFQPGRWSCAACTYSNHPLMAYCEICCTSRDSQTTCNSTESSTLVANASSEVHRSTSGSSKEVSEAPYRQQNSTSCPGSFSQENRTELPNFSLESDIDEMEMMREVDEVSNCTSPVASVVKNTSLLKRLDIESNQPTDDNGVLDSYVDEDLTTGVQVPSNAASDIDFSNVTVHELLQYSCSRNSSRIYVYDKVLLLLFYICVVLLLLLLISILSLHWKLDTFCRLVFRNANHNLKLPQLR